VADPTGLSEYQRDEQQVGGPEICRCLLLTGSLAELHSNACRDMLAGR